MFEPKTLKVRSGCDGGGKSRLVQENKSATLSCNNDQTVFVPKVYGICSNNSNSMKSDNPHSGIYEASTSRTLDVGGGNPSCNQGGMAVVSLQGSMIGRDDKNGPNGDGVNEDISFTLNCTDKHAVAYAMTTGGFLKIEEEKSPALLSRDYKDAPVVGHPALLNGSFAVSPNSFKSLCQKVSFPTICVSGFWTSGASIPPVFSTN